MNPFTITTQITAKEYGKASLAGLYKKPVFILLSIWGLYAVVASFFTSISFFKPEADNPYPGLVPGILLLFLPLLLVLISLSQFNSDRKYRDSIKYTFDEKGMTSEGKTFKSEYAWDHFIKQKDVGKYLVIYHTKKTASFLDKSKLTQEQLEFIKGKVKQLIIFRQAS
jgi:hypothetical protein